MAGFKEFEDIKAWQEARVFANELYKHTAQGAFTGDFGLRNQIRHTAISVKSNIAEGFKRETDKEFIRFLYIARASAGEIRSQLYIARDLNYIPNDESSALINQCRKISGIIFKLIKYLTKNRST